jgi:hypothetical protein
MNLPDYLNSACAATGFDLCYGCADAVRRNTVTGRWFITIMHPGFNTTTNNRAGYATEQAARTVVARLGGR